MVNIQRLYKQFRKLNKEYRKQRNYTFTIVVISLMIYSYWIFIYSTPDLRSLKGYYPNLVTEVYSSEGDLIGEYAVNKRKLIEFDKIPDHVKYAFVSIEDKRFYQHKGIDIKSIFAAILENIRAVDWVRGASTITQQVSKNLTLSFEKSISRKIKEAVIAYRMENYLTKDEILYIYLNHIYLADGVYGIESASQNYFGKSASEINLAEAALLAGLPRRPEYYSPRKNLNRAIGRQRFVLNKMKEQGYISEGQKEEALDFKINIEPKRYRGTVAPYYLEMVKQSITDAYGDEYFSRGGLRIFTSLDIDMSLEAEWSLKRGLIDLNKRHENDIVIRTMSDTGEINNFLIKKNIRDLEAGKDYEGIILDVRKIDNSLYYARVGLGYVSAVLFFSADRIYSNNAKSIQKYIIDKYPSLPLYDSVTIVPSLPRVGDVINVKVTVKSDDTYFCKLNYDAEVQGAIISVDRYGFIKALVGGYDFSKSQFNRALQARRQPGSVFKPVVYAAALNSGYTQLSVLNDRPLSIGEWKPDNYDHRFMGKIPLRTALVKSRNLATVDLMQHITPEYVLSYARKFGFTSSLDPYPSLALGSSAVTVKDIARAFSVFANGGHLLEPKFLFRIYDREGNMILNNVELSNKFEINNLVDDSGSVNADEFLSILKNKRISSSSTGVSNQSISEETAYIVTDILKEVIKNGTGKSARRLNNIAPVAGKTGTTNDYTDAWFAGYSPYLTTVVWVGRDDNMSIGSSESGARAALPIWFDYMADALKKYPRDDFIRPENIKFISTAIGTIAFSKDTPVREENKSSYALGSDKLTKFKNKKKAKSMDDFKKVLKDTLFLPNP